MPRYSKSQLNHIAQATIKQNFRFPEARGVRPSQRSPLHYGFQEELGELHPLFAFVSCVGGVFCEGATPKKVCKWVQRYIDASTDTQRRNLLAELALAPELLQGLSYILWVGLTRMGQQFFDNLVEVVYPEVFKDAPEKLRQLMREWTLDLKKVSLNLTKENDEKPFVGMGVVFQPGLGAFEFYPVRAEEEPSHDDPTTTDASSE